MLESGHGRTRGKIIWIVKDGSQFMAVCGAVDIGGTKIRLGIVETGGRILAEKKLSTRMGKGWCFVQFAGTEGWFPGNYVRQPAPGYEELEGIGKSYVRDRLTVLTV